MAGNLLLGAAVPASVPVAYRVAYKVTADDTYTPQPFRHGVTVTAASLGISGLETCPASHVFHDSWFAHYTLATELSTPSLDNGAELMALAATAASDWYGWRAASLDAAYAGIVAWTPGGLADVVEWSLRSDWMATRVRRAVE